MLPLGSILEANTSFFTPLQVVNNFSNNFKLGFIGSHIKMTDSKQSEYNIWYDNRSDL